MICIFMSCVWGFTPLAVPLICMAAVVQQLILHSKGRYPPSKGHTLVLSGERTNELTQQVSWPPVPIYRTQRKVDTEVQGLPKCMKKKGLKEGT